MKWLLSTTAVAAAFALAPAASAATFVPNTTNFVVTGDPFNGPVSARIGNTGTSAPNTVLQDLFQFTLGQNGVGGGSLTSIAAVFGAINDTDLLSVFVNGRPADLLVDNDNLTETFSLSGVPITAGVLNTIEVNYLSRGQFSYGGNITFNPVAAIPEPGTWAMLLLGFGAVGYAMRRRRREQAGAARTSVRYAF